MIKTVRARVVLGCTALTAALCGCSLALDVERAQCDTDAQCRAAGLGQSCVEHVCALDHVGPSPSATRIRDATRANLASCELDDECKDSAWPRCLGGYCVSEREAVRWLCAPEDAPAADGTPAADTTPLDYSFRVFEYVSKQAPEQVTVRAWHMTGLGCASPVADTASTDGEVRLQLPPSFLGFFEIKGTGVLPQLVYITRPLRRGERGRDVPLIAPDTRATLSAVAGLAADDDNGLVIVEAIDCDGQAAGGVHLDGPSAAAQPFYVVDQLPSLDATVSVRDDANDRASAGFLNAEPGVITIRAQLGVQGPLLGVFSAEVRRSGFTLVQLYAETP